MAIEFRHISKNMSASFSRNTVNEHYPTHMHTHETAELLVFLGGRAVFHVEGTEYRPEKGDVLLVRPTEAHYMIIDSREAYERVVINFDTSLFSSFDVDGRLIKPFVDRKAGTRNLYKGYSFKDDCHISCVKSILNHPESDRINILANLMQMLNEISVIFSENREESGEQTLPYQIIRYINHHLSEDISLESISRRFYISKTQLERIFKKTTGNTMGKYIAIKRLMLARSMISDGKKPTEAYLLCGFRDYSTFYRAYVKKFGESPSVISK